MEKKVALGIAAAVLSMSMASTSSAWFFKTKVKTDVSNIQQQAGRDAYGKSDRSFNRDSSHDIRGDVRNSIVTGKGGFRNTSQNISQAVGNVSVGNSGGFGHAHNKIGDGNNFGNTAVGADQSFRLGDNTITDKRSDYEEDNSVDNSDNSTWKRRY